MNWKRWTRARWWKERARQLAGLLRRRKELDGWARHLGYGEGGVATACKIARRCASAERLSDVQHWQRTKREGLWKWVHHQ